MQIAIPDTYKIVCRLVRGDEELINVFHVQDSVPWGPTQHAAMNQAFARIYADQSTESTPDRGIRDYIDASVQLYSVTTQDIRSVPYDDPQEIIWATAGTAGGDLLPLQTAICVSLRTGQSSPSSRGRAFLGGFSESANAEGTDGYDRPSVAFVNDLAEAFVDLQLRITAAHASADLAVASYKLAASRDVTAVRINNKWSTQRRRAASVPISNTVVVNY